MGVGTVKELIHGRDNLVRAAIVQVGSEGKRTEIKRSVQRLYPVEVSEDDNDCGNKEKEDAAQPVIRFVPDDQVEIVCCNCLYLPWLLFMERCCVLTLKIGGGGGGEEYCVTLFRYSTLHVCQNT